MTSENAFDEETIIYFKPHLYEPFINVLWK